MVNLQEQYDAAAGQVLVLQSRNADPATMAAAVEKASRLRDRLGAERQAAAFRDALSGAAGDSGRRAGQSFGAQIVNSDTFRWLRETKGTRAGVWTSPASELMPMDMMATTLTEGAGSGGALVISDYRPGIMAPAMRPTRMLDLIAPGTTDRASVTYEAETTYTNAAAAVGEGLTKPESTLVFTATTDPVIKIAHWIPVTEEMLEDVSAVQGYLDARLRLGVDLATDDQLLNGNGTSPNMRGILNRVGLASSIARVAEVNADTILSQIFAIWIATNVQPDGIVMHPNNWKTILMTKDTQGQYYGGGPFASPHAPVLWGLPVALTTAIVANTALVGAFHTMSQFFKRGGMRVEASNSHADFFVKNLVAVRAEHRGALCVYRPACFGTCTNLN